MSNVTVLVFDDMQGAENMLANVQTWQENGWIKLEDAVVVTRDEGSNLEVQQTHKFGGKYALRGSGIGLLAGLLLGGPIGGLAAGAAIGGISGHMKDYGIDDKFIKQVSDGLRTNTSALFLMTKEGDEEKIMGELKAHKATVLSTTLPPDQEKRLRKTLEDEQ